MLRLLLFVAGLLFLWPSLRICGADDRTLSDDRPEDRRRMVRELEIYGISSAEVLRAMGNVKRHRFVPARFLDAADPYGDHPCPIGHGQTISQPYIVAYMTERMALTPGEKVLEIGTGSGYQAAVLAELGVKVFSIEIVAELAEHARGALERENYPVQVRTGDGYKGWPEEAPFDAIIVTCAPESVPEALTAQLREGGRMILPVGEAGNQRLIIMRKRQGLVTTEEDLAVRFVPMVHGEDQR